MVSSYKVSLERLEKTLAKLTIRGGNNRLEINIIFTYFWLDFNSYKSGHPDIYQIFKTI